MCNLAFVFTVMFGLLFKKVFLGTLRAAEIELVGENSRSVVIETILALTMFREELSVRVFGLFTGLLFTKIFHWLLQSRECWRMFILHCTSCIPTQLVLTFSLFGWHKEREVVSQIG